jgi:small subunit ribosomal protein S1
VVTFGAFVEIMPGVEGLVHISELAQHHVENPREVVSQGDLVSAKIIEVDAERRRLSLSLKRVEGGGVQERAEDSEVVEGTPHLDLSEDVFPEGATVAEAGLESPAAEDTGPAAPAIEEAAGETPAAAEAPPDEAAPEAGPNAEAPAPEAADASIEADRVAPEEQGPGDSEGEPPAAPEPEPAE